MGTVYRTTTLLIFSLLIGSTVWAAPAAASQTPCSTSVISNQPYQPPDNGGPDGTLGSGTR